MKTLSLIFGFIMVASFGNKSLAQGQDAVFQTVTSSIQTGNAEALSSVFNASVELTVPGVTDGAYASKQAQFVMRDFFASHPVSSFRILTKGNTNNTFYAVGVYVSSKGTFDTNIFVRNMGGSFVVTQIRFEAE